MHRAFILHSSSSSLVILCTGQTPNSNASSCSSSCPTTETGSPTLTRFIAGGERTVTFTTIITNISIADF